MSPEMFQKYPLLSETMDILQRKLIVNLIIRFKKVKMIVSNELYHYNNLTHNDTESSMFCYF